MTKAYYADKAKITLTITIPAMDDDYTPHAGSLETVGIGRNGNMETKPIYQQTVYAGENVTDPQAIIAIIDGVNWNQIIPNKVKAAYKDIIDVDPS